MAWNDGINFGIFGSGNPLVKWGLVLVAILICAGITWWARDENRRVQQIFVALIIGGAIGNVFDRIIYGAVADFINISCCGIKNPYSFNIADVAIFFGAFGLIISSEKKLS
jgi:signal peptidase II